MPRVSTAQALALNLQGHVKTVAIAAQRQTAAHILDKDPAPGWRSPIVVLNDLDDVVI